MDLSALRENGALRERLFQPNRGLSHAYIISGPPGSGRHVLARQMAAAMLCEAPSEERPCGRCTACLKVEKFLHPDVIFFTGPGEGKAITVDQVRALRSDAYIRPNEGNRKIYLLDKADQMNAPAQNAMLKLLEEGPAYAAFLLIADNPGGLLQTVRSRCEELALLPAERPEGAPGDEERAVLIKRLADAMERAGEAELFETALLLDKKRSREELCVLLDGLKEELVNRAVQSKGSRRLLRAADIVETLRGAVRLNVSGGQLSGWLCAGMFEPC